MNTKKTKIELLSNKKTDPNSKTKKIPLKEISGEDAVFQWIVPEAQRKITLSSGKTGESLEGYLPNKQRKRAENHIAQHQQQLMLMC